MTLRRWSLLAPAGGSQGPPPSAQLVPGDGKVIDPHFHSMSMASPYE